MKSSYKEILLFSILSILGAIAIKKIPFDFDASESQMSMSVSYTWKSAAPEAIESAVTAPLEGVLSTLQGISRIESYSGYHYGEIKLSLVPDVDLDRTRFEIASLIRQVHRNLPDGVSYPALSAGQGMLRQDKLFMSVQVTADRSSVEIIKYAEKVLLPALAGTPGIASVSMSGGTGRELAIAYDLGKMTTLGINEQELIAQVQKGLAVKQIGVLKSSNGVAEPLKLQARPDSQMIANTLIANSNGRLLRLRDLATVNMVDKKSTSSFRISGKNTVQLMLQYDQQTSWLEAADHVHERVEQARAKCPAGYEISVDYDSTKYLRQRLRTYANLYISLFMVTIVFFALYFRILKVLMFCALGAISNILIAALIYYLLAIPLSVHTLDAMFPCLVFYFAYTSLFLGVVRNKIKLRFLPSLICGVCISWVGFGILHVFTDTGLDFTAEFLKCMICFQSVGVLIAVLLYPAMAQLLLNMPFTGSCAGLEIRSSSYFLALRTLRRHKASWIAVFVLIYGIPVHLLPARIETKAWYANVYNRTVGSDYYQDHVKHIVNKAFGGTLRLFTEYVYEERVSDISEQTILYINLTMPNNRTFQQMNEAVQSIEHELSRYEQIDKFITNVTGGQLGRISVFFKAPYDTGSFPESLKMKIISISSSMSGIDWDIHGVGRGFNLIANEAMPKPYNILLKGYSYAELDRILSELRTRLEKHPRVKDIESTRVPGMYQLQSLDQFRFHFDPDYWSRLANQTEIFQLARMFAVNNDPDFFFIASSSQTPVTFQPQGSTDSDIVKLLSSPLYHHSDLLKLGKYSSIIKERTVPALRKVDQEYLRELNFQFIGSVELGDELVDGIIEEVESGTPLGFSIERQGIATWGRDIRHKFQLVGLVLALVFMIFGITFESVRDAVILIFCMLISYSGVFISFYVSGASFDIGGYTSLFMVILFTGFPMILILNDCRSTAKGINQSLSIALFAEIIAERRRLVLGYYAVILISSLPVLLFENENPSLYTLILGCFGAILVSCITLFFLLPILLSKKETDQK
jgi:multidrug efflux pump subunit AcrB